MVLCHTTKISTTFAFGVPNIKVQDNKGLYAELENKNVSDIDLSTAYITSWKKYYW